MSRIAATWVGLMAAMVGGWFGFAEYREANDKKLDEASKTAMDLILRFQGGDFFPIRQAVYAHVFAGEPIDDNERFAFVEFFDTAAVCIEHELCNADVMEQVFPVYATTYFPCLRKHIEDTRAAEVAMGLADLYGQGMERLSRGLASDGHCRNLGRTSFGASQGAGASTPINRRDP